jgi:hypothetical protein
MQSSIQSMNFHPAREKKRERERERLVLTIDQVDCGVLSQTTTGLRWTTD